MSLKRFLVRIRTHHFFWKFSKVLLFLFLWPSGGFSEELFIGSFNPQIFGQSKIRSSFSLQYLLKITSRYDIFFMQEIREKLQGPKSSIQKFLTHLRTKTKRPWQMALSERVGGGQTSIEQYAFFYREDKVDLLKSYLVPKKISKIVRTPFIAHFRPKGSEFDFAMIGVHTDPDLAEKEILNLGKVFKYVGKLHQEKDTIILGDFNAGCTYLNLAPTDSPYLTLENMDGHKKTFIKDPLIFDWLINNDIKTNTAHVNCPYDRIVVSGKVKKHVVPHFGKAFYFDKAWGLSYEETRKVSDHYPVELKLNVDLSPTSFSFVKDCRSPRSAKDFPAKKTFWALKKILAVKNCQELYDVLPEYEWIDLSFMGVTDLTPLKEFSDLSIFLKN